MINGTRKATRAKGILKRETDLFRFQNPLCGLVAAHKREWQVKAAEARCRSGSLPAVCGSRFRCPDDDFVRPRRIPLPFLIVLWATEPDPLFIITVYAEKLQGVPGFFYRQKTARSRVPAPGGEERVNGTPHPAEPVSIVGRPASRRGCRRRRSPGGRG